MQHGRSFLLILQTFVDELVEVMDVFVGVLDVQFDMLCPRKANGVDGSAKRFPLTGELLYVLSNRRESAPPNSKFVFR